MGRDRILVGGSCFLFLELFNKKRLTTKKKKRRKKITWNVIL
jgi:hypothetical protein